MAIPIRQRYTLDEFQEYILKPENLHKTFEYIINGGQVLPDFTLPLTDFMPKDRTQDGNKS